MILKYNATVTICHSKTPDLGSFTRQADILIAAVGRAKMIKKDMVKPGAIVVDAGINEIPGGICGDVDFEGVQEVAALISPVPGGVGSLTTALIMRNVLKGNRSARGNALMDMNKVWEWTTEEFLTVSASSSPTPGGGSVSAYVGALAHR